MGVSAWCHFLSSCLVPCSFQGGLWLWSYVPFGGVCLDRDHLNRDPPPPGQKPLPRQWPHWIETPLHLDIDPLPLDRDPSLHRDPFLDRDPTGQIPLYCKEWAVRILLECILVLKNWLPRIALIIFSLELKRFLYFWFLVPDRTFPSSYVFKKCSQQPFAFSCLRGISCWHCTYG